MGERRVIVIVGPTASGKSALALQLALRLDGEIISADSRQIYRMMDIGTAKPTPEERALVPHHFIDERNPDESFSAGVFGEEGRTRIEGILARGRAPIVVGGSGLYVRALIDGLFEGPGGDRVRREILQERLETEGLGALLADLERVDPETAARIDRTKPRRVIRALEVHALTGRPISAMQREHRVSPRFSHLQFGIELPRSELYRRIDKRCDGMLEEGLLDEVDRLADAGYGGGLNALNSVGYREAFAYRAGAIDRAEMVRLFKRNSRRYAKRQLTWFRRDTRIVWDSAERLATLAGNSYLDKLQIGV